MSVSAVIPAYNEENTIGDIVRVVRQAPEVDEVIVVSDGSRDKTATEARLAGARVIELPENMGKGGAMHIGAKNSQSEFVLFLDADLVGLTVGHVQSLIHPVLEENTEMTVGIFEKGRIATDLAQLVAPYLSGQRVLKKDLLQEISDLEACRFGVEVALTQYARENGVRVQEVELAGMTHIMKEEKMGLVRGLAARMKMYWDIAKVMKKRIG